MFFSSSEPVVFDMFNSYSKGLSTLYETADLVKGGLTKFDSSSSVLFMHLQSLTAAELVSNFSLLDDWEARYAYVIDLGKYLPAFPESDKTEANIVRGCTSQVWLIPQKTSSDIVSFLADSDAHIVRGLIAILMVVYNDKPKDIVRRFDIEEFFGQLGLAEHLSPNRRNGFFAMVGRIKSLAE